jgi:hypothetical protein
VTHFSKLLRNINEMVKIMRGGQTNSKIPDQEGGAGKVVFFFVKRENKTSRSKNREVCCFEKHHLQPLNCVACIHDRERGAI